MKHLLLLLPIMTFLPGCDFIRGYAEGEAHEMKAINGKAPQSDLRVQRFLFEDFGHLNTDTLETSALPWKVVGTALVMLEAQRSAAPLDKSTLKKLFQRYGFVFARSVGNAPGVGVSPDKPLGLITGDITRSIPGISLEAANIGCAACHSGRLYDSEGHPTETVWAGLPNSDLNLDLYISEVYAALQLAFKSDEQLFESMKSVFPDTSELELATIRKYALPPGKERFEVLKATLGKPLPFENGGPGITNGVAALKMRLGVISDVKPAQEYGYTSIPDLGGTLLRSSLLYDGVYASPNTERFQPRQTWDSAHSDKLANITAFFTIPTQGATPKSAEAAIPEVKEVFGFLESYTPPAFPGTIDRQRASRGQKIYATHCQSCHGSYSDKAPHVLTSFPNLLVAQAEIKTDTSRMKAIDAATIAAIKASTMGDYIDPKISSGYVASPLTAVWATAPYLHNGSVPTLWHLMNPDQRPRRFQVGGHRLNFEMVGIDGELRQGIYSYPADYRSAASTQIYDTTAPGKSNAGHEQPFDQLSPAEKADLLEFLKLL